MALSRPPYPLPSDIREQLRCRFERGLQEPPNIPPAHLVEKKIAILQRSDSKWIADLGRVSRCLWDMYSALQQERHTLGNSSVAAIKLSLNYLVDPFDVIPDTVVKYGYLDDFHVVHMCVRHLYIESPNVVSIYFQMVRGRVVDVHP